MVYQREITLHGYGRGIHLITNDILSVLPPLPERGLLHLFICHTSAALAVNENAAPDVRHDLEAFFDRSVREREAYYRHTDEGDDDMPAHIKAVLTGPSVTLPVTGGRLNIGRWQGIYLCEFRNTRQDRRIIATILS